VATAAGVLALSGCAAGFHPQTTPSLQPRDGQNDPVLGYSSAIAIRHAFILGPAPDAAAFPKHSDAALYVNIINQTNRRDKLLAVQTAAARTVLVGDRASNAGASPSPTPSGTARPTGGTTQGPEGTPTPSPSGSAKPGHSPSPSPTQPTSIKLAIPPSSSDVGAVAVGRPPYSDNTITLTDLTRGLDNGAVVTVTFVFQRAGSMTVDVPVMPQAGPLETLSPAPSAQSTPTG
jgi:copper(I)-binding protein